VYQVLVGTAGVKVRSLVSHGRHGVFGVKPGQRTDKPRARLRYSHRTRLCELTVVTRAWPRQSAARVRDLPAWTPPSKPPLPAAMFGFNLDLLDQLSFYGSYHRNFYNKLVHLVFVPGIAWSTMVWLAATGSLLGEDVHFGAALTRWGVPAVLARSVTMNKESYPLPLRGARSSRHHSATAAPSPHSRPGFGSTRAILTLVLPFRQLRAVCNKMSYFITLVPRGCLNGSHDEYVPKRHLSLASHPSPPSSKP